MPLDEHPDNILLSRLPVWLRPARCRDDEHWTQALRFRAKTSNKRWGNCQEETSRKSRLHACFITMWMCLCSMS